MEKSPGTGIIPFLVQKNLENPGLPYDRLEYDTPHLTAEESELIAKHVDIHLLFLQHDHRAEHYRTVDEVWGGLAPEDGRLIIETFGNSRAGKAVTLSDMDRRAHFGDRHAMYMEQLAAGQTPKSDVIIFARLIARSKGVPIVIADFSDTDDEWWLECQRAAGSEDLPNYWNNRDRELWQRIPELPFAEAVAIYSTLFEGVNTDLYDYMQVNFPEMQRQRDRIAINILKHWALHDARQAEAGGTTGKKHIAFIYGLEHARPMMERLRDYGIPYSSKVIPHETFARHGSEDISGLTEEDFMLEFTMRLLAESLPGSTQRELDDIAHPFSLAIHALPKETLRDVYECYRAGRFRAAGEDNSEYLMRLFAGFSAHTPAYDILQEAFGRSFGSR